MNPQRNQLHPSPTFKRRREELLACRRCGREKAICDGHPCADCGYEGVVCDGEDCGHPGGATNRGYIEWLEGERAILSLGLQEACRRLIAANVWPRESLPHIGRPLSTYEMLATLGLMQGSKDQNLESVHLTRGDHGRTELPFVTKHASGKQALDSNSYQHTYTPGYVDRGVPRGESSSLPTAHLAPPSFQSTATTLASPRSSVDAGSSWMVLTDTSLPRSTWPVATSTIPPDSRVVAPSQDGQLWRYTTDAWQDVSGPSNLGNRTFSVLSGAQGLRRYENVSRHGSGHPPGMHEVMPSEQDETPPDSDGDRSEYIRIPF